MSYGPDTNYRVDENFTPANLAAWKCKIIPFESIFRAGKWSGWLGWAVTSHCYQGYSMLPWPTIIRVDEVVGEVAISINQPTSEVPVPIKYDKGFDIPPVVPWVFLRVSEGAILRGCRRVENDYVEKDFS